MLVFFTLLLSRWVCVQFMGNLRSAMLEISALLSTRQAGMPFFVIPSPLSLHLCLLVLHILFCVLQIPGKTVWFDKGHNSKRASSDRHNSHSRCSVLPTLPYDSPMRDSEVTSHSPRSPLISIQVPYYRGYMQQPGEPKLGNGNEWSS